MSAHDFDCAHPLSLPDGMPPLHGLMALGGIAASLQVVEQLRSARHASAILAQHTQDLKRWQAARFQRTYADVLNDPRMGAAAQFFLSELYSEQEFSKRDAQFARIAGTLERIFPHTVVQTATLLAQLHALSESLDANMARVWIHNSKRLSTQLDERCYQRLWQSLEPCAGYSAARLAQLRAAQDLGGQLQRHTRVPGLRFMLKMMRTPAAAAGLQQLQQFLERGFDTFAALGRAGKVEIFLDIIQTREQAWLVQMTRVKPTYN